ncbi:MAG: hypothetical protein P8R54_12750 [Myxococcota bacterium]|nr:hypothetical protein [Myxococcota bacterium]
MIRFLLAAAHAEEPSAPAAVEPPTVDAATAAAFADHLLSSGDAYAALSWYRLSEFLAPSPTTTFRIGLAYEHGERLEAAADVYGRLDTPEAALRAALCLHRSGSTQAADARLAVLQLRHPTAPQADHADYIRGVLALEAHDLSAAADHFSAVSGGLAEPAAALSIAAQEPIPQRSPGVASALSLVPGVGQMYAGHVGDGLIAMGVTGGLSLWGGSMLATGIVEDRRGLITIGGVLTGVALITWSSNLVGAYTGAARFNRLTTQRRAEALLEAAWREELALEPPLPE